MATTTAIFGAFNVESYVGQAISSIADQVDEVVVVDDASSDKTLDIIQGLTRRHKNLHIIANKDNLGVSLSYNLAAEQAEGEILFLCGSDDVSLPGRVARQLRVLQSSEEIGATFSKPELIRADGLKIAASAAIEFVPRPDSRDVFGHLIFLGNFLLAPSAALSKELFLGLGGFTRNLDLLQDYELWLKISQFKNIEVLESPVVQYRKRVGSSSGFTLGHESRRSRELAERSFILSRVISSTSETNISRLLDFLRVRNDHRMASSRQDLRDLIKVMLDLDSGKCADFELILNKSEYSRDLRDHVLVREEISKLFAFN
jgi:hypothetical protein